MIDGRVTSLSGEHTAQAFDAAAEFGASAAVASALDGRDIAMAKLPLGAGMIAAFQGIYAMSDSQLKDFATRVAVVTLLQYQAGIEARSPKPRTDDEVAIDALARMRPIHPMPAGAGVYFVQVDRFVKIGVATNVRERVAGMMTSFPVKPRLLMVAPGGLAVEQDLHKRFAYLQSHREWFHIGGDLARFILDHRATGPEATTTR